MMKNFHLLASFLGVEEQGNSRSIQNISSISVETSAMFTIKVLLEA